MTNDLELPPRCVLNKLLAFKTKPPRQVFSTTMEARLPPPPQVPSSRHIAVAMQRVGGRMREMRGGA